jgi:4-hydroxy-4-methyl-2-oxoglutarate aldolase
MADSTDSTVPDASLEKSSNGLAEGMTVKELSRLGSSTLHEASGRIGAIPAAIHAMTNLPPFAGPAVTVCGPPGDNLWLHRAIYECQPGDVIIASVSGAYEWGYWGEILSSAALARGIAGVVIDGCVRDIVQLTEVGVPVFARGAAIRGTMKYSDGVGEINEDLVIGEIVIRPGDWVIGDEDGVVVLPRERLESVFVKARARAEQEADFIVELRRGKRTLDLYDFPS